MKFSRRRAFLLAAAALSVPSVTLGQQQRHIGILSLQSRDADTRMPAFIAGLRDLGYIDGGNIRLQWRFADGDTARLLAQARELVALRVDVIVAVQTQAIEAAQRATSAIPIVFCATGDPVGSGFAKSLSRPGGNITGVSTITNELGPKQLEMIKLALPQSSSVGVLMNPTNKASAELRRSIEIAAQKSGIRTIALDARSQTELEQAIAAAAHERVGALIILADGYLFQARKLLADVAVKHRLPTLGWSRELADAGALMTYGPALRENYYRAAAYVDRILKGAKPWDLAIEQPTKVEFVVNLKTAKQLGIAIPESVLLRTNSVIQ